MISNYVKFLRCTLRLQVSRTLILVVGSSFIAGCGSVGPLSVEYQRTNYNTAIVRTNEEQLLLNLVRLRYRDTPFFLSVTNITSRFNLNVNGSAKVPNLAGNDIDQSVSLAAGGSFTESPTIVYSPVTGEQFIRDILSPIPPGNIALLAQSGWSIERIMLLCVQALNNLFNAPSASGPTPGYAPQYQEFSQFAAMLRDLQRARAIEIGTVENGNAVLRFFPNAELTEQINQVKSILGMSAETNELITSQIREYDGAWMRTRSPIGVMQFIAQSIEVPEEHYQSGIVTRTLNDDGTPFEWRDVTGGIVSISSRKQEPDNAFLSVRYRDWWFYIPDSDLNSKTTFSMLSMLIAMQSGRIQNTAVINTISLD
jgi:hypothetical protein